jgi:hypothetical protein
MKAYPMFNQSPRDEYVLRRGTIAQLPGCFTPGEKTPVHIGYDAVWTPEMLLEKYT